MRKFVITVGLLKLADDRFLAPSTERNRSFKNTVTDRLYARASGAKLLGSTSETDICTDVLYSVDISINV